MKGRRRKTPPLITGLVSRFLTNQAMQTSDNTPESWFAFLLNERMTSAENIPYSWFAFAIPVRNTPHSWFAFLPAKRTSQADITGSWFDFISLP